MLFNGWVWLAALVLQAGEGAAADPCQVLLARLGARVYRAHLHKDVLAAHRLSREAAGALMGAERPYTEKMFPVRVERREEWSPAQGDGLSILEPALHVEILELCRGIQAEPRDRHSPLRRLALQSEIWAAFDGLHVDGLLLPRSGDPQAERRERLLDALARTMLHVALEDTEFERLPSPAGLQREVFGVLDPAEFYTLEIYPLHDGVNRFRKASRFFYADPGRDFARLTDADLNRLKERTLPLNPGGLALLREDIVAITRTGALRPTEVPSVLKYYRVKDGVEFGIRILDPWTKDESAGLESALVPYDGEAWALINLPNIPGHGQPAYRAPLHDTCLGCHGAYPNAFRPRIQRAQSSRHFQFTRDPQPWTSSRAIQFKSISGEFADLQRRVRPETAAPEPPPAPASPRMLVAGGVALGVLLLGLWVGRRKRESKP